MRNFAITLVCVLIGLPAAAQSVASDACGPLKPPGQFGPFDYRKEHGEPLQLVQGAHFPPKVEQLIGGNRGYLGGDIDYTLRAFPNHHRALVSMMEYAKRTQQDPPPHMHYTVECYLDRAIRMAPDDVIVRILYAQYLASKSRIDEADAQLRSADTLAGNDGFTHYNIGLAYLEMKQYERALSQAHQALALGMTRDALKNALIAAGKWVDAPQAPAPAPAAAASTPAGPEASAATMTATGASAAASASAAE
jgi:hypothetical protein